jgi:2',3'-cyclic-nucleotide 2'-phosphodiesterase (5'-nucleotidase family)
VADPNREQSEAGLGAFLAAAQRDGAHADLGFMNNGGIRKRLAPGPITKQDLFEVLPFRNMLMKFNLTGKQVQDIAMHYLLGRPGIIIAGLSCEWKKDASGNIVIVKLLINGKPVEENATYTGAASDYMMGEAKRYLGIDPPQLTDLNETVFNAVEKKVREMKNVEAKADRPFSEIK